MDHVMFHFGSSGEELYQKVTGACQGGNRRTRWWTPEMKGTVKLKTEAFHAWLAGGSAEVWANCQKALVSETRQEGQLLTWTGDVLVWRKEHFSELLNPANTSSWEEAESKDLGEDSSISLADITEIVKRSLVARQHMRTRFPLRC